MSKFAIIPWSEKFADDRIFDINPPTNRDYLLEPYLELKQEFERQGHEIHTLDRYGGLEEADYYLFFALEWDIYKKIVRIGRSDRMVYCNSEPPSVHKYNSPKGFRVLKHIFPYILTWNDDWVDGKSIFKRNTPYWFADQREGNLPFSEKKLITCISGNKRSDFPGELYSERERAINYFEQFHPDEFDLYGTGWDENEHPCYRGRVENKARTYHKYRFAICYENIEGLKGYVTEKLLDCLVSGIVPIYAGSLDIGNYVPKECYINLRDYDSYESMYSYISRIEESDYQTFLCNAEAFIRSQKSEYFSGARYANYILEAIEHDKGDFRTSPVSYKIFKYLFYR